MEISKQVSIVTYGKIYEIIRTYTPKLGIIWKNRPLRQLLFLKYRVRAELKPPSCRSPAIFREQMAHFDKSLVESWGLQNLRYKHFAFFEHPPLKMNHHSGFLSVLIAWLMKMQFFFKIIHFGTTITTIFIRNL